MNLDVKKNQKCWENNHMKKDIKKYSNFFQGRQLLQDLNLYGPTALCSPRNQEA